MKNTIISILVIIIIAAGGYFFLTGDFISGTRVLALETNNLEELESGHYEAWLTFDRGVMSLGKFDTPGTLSFDLEDDITDARLVVVTVEPDGDEDNLPSGIIVLAGAIEESGAALSFPVDFSGASGSYILATPTDDPEENETSGVWFLKLPEPLTSGLILPELAGGWTYEGWAVIDGSPFSTGRFSSAEGEDSSRLYSGDGDGPPFPGEDFIVSFVEGVEFPADLADGESVLVISVEPDLNGVDPTGDGPFSAKPLVAQIPEGATDHTNYDMELDLDSLPSGSAEIRQ